MSVDLYTFDLIENKMQVSEEQTNALFNSHVQPRVYSFIHHVIYTMHESCSFRNPLRPAYTLPCFSVAFQLIIGRRF